MKSIAKTGFVLVLAASLFACSEHSDTDTPTAEKEHFASEKVQAIKKAEAVNQLLQDAAAAQRRRIDEDSQ